MRWKAHRAFPWLVVAAMGLLSKCGIFETREPEFPSQTSSNYVPPTEPSFVLSNMANSFRDMNTVNYLRSFADSGTAGRSFVFEPTSHARSKYGGVFLNWARESEQRYFENIKSKIPSGSTPTLAFESVTVLSRQADMAQYEVTYRLMLPHSLATIPTEARGRTQFFFVPDRFGNWVIWRWVDVTESATTFTWSDVKGEFGQ
jgi:hypothetical protein